MLGTENNVQKTIKVLVRVSLKKASLSPPSPKEFLDLMNPTALNIQLLDQVLL